MGTIPEMGNQKDCFPQGGSSTILAAKRRKSAAHGVSRGNSGTPSSPRGAEEHFSHLARLPTREEWLPEGNLYENLANTMHISKFQAGGPLFDASTNLGGPSFALFAKGGRGVNFYSGFPEME